MKTSEVLLKSRNQPEDFTIRIRDEAFLPKADAAELQKIWEGLQEAAHARGNQLWDGTYYRLINLDALKTKDTALKDTALELSTVQYSTVRALIEKNKTSPLEISQFPLQMNTGALIKTADGFFIFGQKGTGPASVANADERFAEIIGGGLQSSELQVKQGRDLARNILKEMHEEINISPEHVAGLESLGFILAGDTMGIVMVFEVLLSLKLQEVKVAFETRAELEFSALLAVAEKDLESFLAAQKGYMTLLSQLLN